MSEHQFSFQHESTCSSNPIINKGSSIELKLANRNSYSFLILQIPNEKLEAMHIEIIKTQKHPSKYE